MNREEFIQKAEEFKISKVAREAVSRSLEDLVPTQDISPKKIEYIKNKVYETILFVAEHYDGRYDQVPNMYLAEGIRDCIPYGLSREARQEVSHIANIVESVRRKKSERAIRSSGPQDIDADGSLGNAKRILEDDLQ